MPKNLVPLKLVSSKIQNDEKLKNKVSSVEYADYPKKYKVTFNNGKIVEFGHQDYKDFLFMLYSDVPISYAKERRRLYRIRHDDEKDQSIYTPGYLSYWILW